VSRFIHNILDAGNEAEDEEDDEDEDEEAELAESNQQSN
jgi:hypothetical protein